MGSDQRELVLDYVAKVVPPRLVFLGDSNTAGGGNWGWRVLGNPISAINLGVNNYTIRQVAFMVPRAAEYRPSVVAVMAGTNDILANHASVEQIRRDFDFLMDALARVHEESIVTPQLLHCRRRTPRAGNDHRWRASVGKRP